MRKFKVVTLVGPDWLPKEIVVHAIDEDDALYRALEKFSEMGYEIEEGDAWILEVLPPDYDDYEDLEYGEID